MPPLTRRARHINKTLKIDLFDRFIIISTIQTLVSLCACQIRTFCPKSGRWGKPELSLPIWIRIFKRALFCRPSSVTKGPRTILNTTPFLQPRVGSGFPGSFLVCLNGVVNKIALGPFVPEGLQKVSFKIRIQSGRESYGLPQRPDLGQNFRIWQPQRLTKVCIVENNNDPIKQIYFQCLAILSGSESRRGHLGLDSPLRGALDSGAVEGCPSKGGSFSPSEGSVLCKI